MTGEELVKMWREESDAANDCIIDILESIMEFTYLAKMHAKLRNDPWLEGLAERHAARWMPILEHAKKAKEKANETEI